MIAIGCDHGAFELKNQMVEHFKKRGIELKDVGCYSLDSCDYPEYAKKVTDLVTSGECELGILICGTGIGMSLAANKVNGVRAAACSEVYSAKLTRMHNDANVLCLGARVIGIETAKMMVDAFVETDFEGGRHQRRVDMITALEENN